MSDPTSRRDFLALSTAALSGGLMSREQTARASEGAAPERPNILMILVDDLGYGDLQSFGAPDLRTPHIDSIVRDGMRFDNAYANCPVCSPTRASLLSGRYPERVGVPGVIRTYPDESWGHLVRDCKMLPEFLGENGYRTSIVGKWHLGLNEPNTPNDRGFDFFHGFLGDMMEDYYTHLRHGINYMRRDREEINPSGHASDLFSDWAADIIRDHDGREPFFIYLSYNAPHVPLHPPETWLQRVRQRESGLDENRAKLAALIEHMDDGIGRVLAALRESGLDSNTLVVFASDNGGQLNIGANNQDVRDGKTTMYEGGIRVPMAARWPGKIAAGSRSDRVTLSMDLMPTFLDAAGIETEYEMDGRSILPTLLGQSQPDPERDLFFVRLEGWDYAGRRSYAIRRGDWKLLRSHPDSELELYNLKDDPREQRDLANTNKAKFEELHAALKAHHERYKNVPWEPPERHGL